MLHRPLSLVAAMLLATISVSTTCFADTAEVETIAASDSEGRASFRFARLPEGRAFVSLVGVAALSTVP